jgi:hypothetical protein
MSEGDAGSAATASGSLADIVREFTASTAFVLRLVTASSEGALRCFVEAMSSATALSRTSHSESSTDVQQIAPELRMRLDGLIKAAREQVLEDGMSNAITQNLPALVAQHVTEIVPLLVAAFESNRTPPAVSAEILKELGRIRDAASHAARLWVLEHALQSPFPLTRDGAGLGLARLGDPDALRYLERAIQHEPVAELRDDLRLVADELSDNLRHGPATKDPQ